MKNNEANYNIYENYFAVEQQESQDLIIKQQPDCFIEDEDRILINLQDGNRNTKKSHSSSVKTNASYGEIQQNENAYFSFGDNQDFQIKKEMTKESMEILKLFVEKENNILPKNINVNLNFENNIKDIKYNMVNINEKIETYFKRPYMRKNIKKNIIDVKVDMKNICDEEKIKFKGKNIEELKDDDIKTNNDSFEDEYNLLDKKKFK